MTMPVAGEGDAALPRMVVTDDGRLMRLVDEETLRYFRSRPLRPPLMRAYSPELMRRMGLDEEEVATVLRAFWNEQAVRRIHAEVLQQYSARGYAYLEIPELYADHDMDQQATKRPRK